MDDNRPRIYRAWAEVSERARFRGADFMELGSVWAGHATQSSIKRSDPLGLVPGGVLEERAEDLASSLSREPSAFC